MKMLYDFYDKEIARISIFIRKFYFECREGVKNVTRDLKYAVKFLFEMYLFQHEKDKAIGCTDTEKHK